VCGTLDVSPVQIEKLIRHPVQRAAGMRTAIEITVDLTGLAYQNDIQQALRSVHGYPPAARVRDVIEAT
jgi:hypothetical protein